MWALSIILCSINQQGTISHLSVRVMHRILHFECVVWKAENELLRAWLCLYGLIYCQRFKKLIWAASLWRSLLELVYMSWMRAMCKIWKSPSKNRALIQMCWEECVCPFWRRCDLSVKDWKRFTIWLLQVGGMRHCVARRFMPFL